MVIRRAPFSIPPGLNVAARLMKLFCGFPSSSVPTPGFLPFKSGLPTTIKPSYLSVT